MTLTQQIAVARLDYARLARFADRRERFLSSLDWSALSDRFARETSMDDDRINEDLAFAWLYVKHLGMRLALEGDEADTWNLRFLPSVPRALAPYASSDGLS